jgi:hypothetical protein
MKRLLSFILVFGILMQVSGGVMQLLEYSINKTFIATRICEKKAIPDNGCEGKCHLKKELKKESQREQDNPQQTSKSIADWQLIDSVNNQIIAPEVYSTTFPMVYSANFYPGYPGSVFHPPGC